jgi:rSAM/selenodomain-associated transferase 1
MSQPGAGSAAGAAGCLLLFTKPAVPGRVKTRLIGALTPGEAASLHEAFLADLVSRLAASPRFALRLAWALEPGEEVPPGPPAGLRQEGADLGERLYRALAAAAAEHPLVAAVGSDHPRLAVERVEQAFDLLASGAPVVLGPAEDGGYYLVGARREALTPRLFEEVPWSGPRVLEATLERCAELGLRPRLLPPEADVDTPEDLARLSAELAAGPAAACPRTSALLARWGRLEAP